MKTFEMPVVDVIKFSVEDVITVSGEASGETPAPPALIPPCG